MGADGTREAGDRLLKGWVVLRGVLAVAGLAVPLTLAGLSRHFPWILGSIAVLGAVGWAIRSVLPLAWRITGIVYLALCAALASRAIPLTLEIHPDTWWRVSATAAGLVALFGIDARSDWRGQRLGSAGSRRAVLLGDALVLAAAAIVFRLGMLGLFANPGVLSALLIGAPVLVLRPPPAALALWLACAVNAVYGWLGFMNGARYIGRLDPAPPAGITVEALVHGDPTRMPGARFFRPGECPQTQDSFYMGEGSRTYRLEPDGSETVFVDGAESTQNLIERCELDEVITGSFEGKFVRFARLGSGEVIADIEVPSHPAFLVLDEDRNRLFVSTSIPAGMVAIDLATHSIVKVLDHYFDRDPLFSGTIDMLPVGDRLVGTYTSWFLLDRRPGELFSVNRDLEDLQVHFGFPGAWGFLLPDPAGPQRLFLKAYFYPRVWRTGLSGDSWIFAELPHGFNYMTTLPDIGLMVLDQWTTGEILALCIDHPERRFRIETGGMGRMLWPRANQVFTPSASGYLTVTFPEALCR